jgi:hypothetical protein
MAFHGNWSDEDKQKLFNKFNPTTTVTGGGTNFANLGGSDTFGDNSSSITSKFVNDPGALANFYAQGAQIRANRNSYSSPYFLGNSSTAAGDAEGGFSQEDSDFANGWGNGNSGGGTEKETDWFSGDKMKGYGAIMGGVGSLGSAWASLKNVGVAKQALAEQVAQWDRNYAAQRTTANNQIANQNAWKTAQGRSDMGTMVG